MRSTIYALAIVGVALVAVATGGALAASDASPDVSVSSADQSPTADNGSSGSQAPTNLTVEKVDADELEPIAVNVTDSDEDAAVFTVVENGSDGDADLTVDVDDPDPPEIGDDGRPVTDEE